MAVELESHPLEPFLPGKAVLLMLGSFPPQRKRWSMDFFYPNLQNDMWRIFGLLFFGNKEHFLLPGRKAFDKERIVEFLLQKGIALYDTATTVRRLQDNASDKFLEIVESTDVQLLLKQLPDCRAVVTTGQKATDTLRALWDIDAEPPVSGKIRIENDGNPLWWYRMPSSSRAYPLKIEKKTDAYRFMFSDLGLISPAT